MKMQKETANFTRYTLEDGFFVHVLPEGDLVSFWLGNENADVQERMFALSRELAPEERWESLLEDNLSEYMEDFREGWLED